MASITLCRPLTPLPGITLSRTDALPGTMLFRTDVLADWTLGRTLSRMPDDRLGRMGTEPERLFDPWLNVT